MSSTSIMAVADQYGIGDVYGRAFKASALGLGLFDVHFRSCVFDQRAAEMLGIESDQTYSFGELQERIHPEDRAAVDLHLKSAPRNGDPARLQYRVALPDAGVRWVGASTRRFTGSASVNAPTAGGVIHTLTDLSEIKSTEEQYAFLVQEMHHRQTNLLSIVDSIARSTARTGDQSTFTARFSPRLHSLHASQELLIQNRMKDVPLKEIVERQLCALMEGTADRIQINGPNAVLSEKAAQAVAMAVHELMTNAVKYGALSKDTGLVSVDWTLEEKTAPKITIVWRETGGPKVKAPEKTGFGTTVIKDMAARSTGGEVELQYLESGLVWMLTVSGAGS